jgi:pimeloyl-ACP methyl ester carboxylesterase
VKSLIAGLFQVALPRIVVTAAAIAAIVILFQDTLIYPSAHFSFSDPPPRDPRTIPPEVESVMVSTLDGQRLEVWRYPVRPRAGQPKRVAIISHGNGGDVSSMFSYQEWFESLGITSYAFDYRGYGHSTGWPSESGIQEDERALWKYVTDRENVAAENVILLGLSLGTGPSSYLASLYSPKALVLIAPYTSLVDVVNDRPFYKYISAFLWSRFPSKEYLTKLTTTCVVAAHGERDREILPHHLKDLAGVYKGSGGFTALFNAQADHNTIFDAERKHIGDALKFCLAN